MQAFGIDIGGTGIKGAPVDLATGKLLAERKKLPTPRPSTPKAVSKVVAEVVQSFGWTGPAAATFPGVVTGGTVRTAANVDKSWIGTDAATMFGKVVGSDVAVLNDADAAGIAEMTFGAGVGERGTVLMLTFGTGVGSALFTGGLLVPNTEFGHIEVRGKDAESRASEHAKVAHGWGWKDWTTRVSEYLQRTEALLSPDLIIVGGGISKESDRWIPLLTGVRARVVAATLHNDAGIVGAAMAAAGIGTASLPVPGRPAGGFPRRRVGRRCLRRLRSRRGHLAPVGVRSKEGTGRDGAREGSDDRRDIRRIVCVHVRAVRRTVDREL